VLATTPLTWYYYGALQTGALLINLFVIPFIGLMVMVSFIFLPLSFWGGMTAAGAGQLIYYIFRLIQTVVGHYAGLPFVQLYLPHPSPFSLLLIIVLIVLLFHLNRRRARLWFTGGLFLFLVVLLIGRSNTQKLQYTQLDVRQGDCALLRFPGGTNILVDGGQNFPFDAAKRFVVPVLRYYGVNRLRYLVGTHNHNDHIGGFLTLLREIRVDTLVLSPKAGRSRLYRVLLDEAAQRNIPVVHRRRGQRLYTGSACRVYLLHPTQRFVSGGFSGREVNNSSLVLKVVYGQTAFLLTGDLEISGEQALYSFGDFLRAQLLKTGHHGSVTSTSQSFLDWVRPAYALISVGRGNKYRHPGKRTIRRLRENGAAVLRTDHLGALVFESDGRRLRLVNWRTW